MNSNRKDFTLISIEVMKKLCQTEHERRCGYCNAEAGTGITLAVVNIDVNRLIKIALYSGDGYWRKRLNLKKRALKNMLRRYFIWTARYFGIT